MDLKAKVLLLMIIAMMSFITFDLRKQNLDLKNKVEVMDNQIKEFNNYFQKSIQIEKEMSILRDQYKEFSLENFRNLNEDLFTFNH